MRLLPTLALLSACCAGVTGQVPLAFAPGTGNAATVPAGTKIPVALKQAISTKSAREGDVVYAETTFPFVQDGKVLIPAGTYLQGQIVHSQRPGRVHGRAEVLIHFTSLVYPNGYTVPLPGAIDKVPGTETTGVKDPGRNGSGGQPNRPESGRYSEHIREYSGQGSHFGRAARGKQRRSDRRWRRRRVGRGDRFADARKGCPDGRPNHGGDGDPAAHHAGSEPGWNSLGGQHLAHRFPALKLH